MLKRFFIILLLPFCYSALATAAKSKGVYAVHDGNSVVIGNEFLAREFSLVNGHVRTQTIVNRSGDFFRGIHYTYVKRRFCHCGTPLIKAFTKQG